MGCRESARTFPYLHFYFLFYPSSVFPPICSGAIFFYSLKNNELQIFNIINRILSLITHAPGNWKLNGVPDQNSIPRHFHDRYHDVNESDSDRWKIQKIITDIIETKIRSSLYMNGTGEDKARLTALSQPYAMLVERVSRPNLNRQSVISDLAAVHRFRMILGLRPTNNDEKCQCGQPLTSTHTVSCINTRKLCAEPRHNIVRDAIKQSLDYFNLHTQIEYRPLAYSRDGVRKRIRPDGKTPHLNAMWDVEVNTATCKSYRDRGSETDGNITFNHSELSNGPD